MARFFVRTLAELGEALTLAPERHLAAKMHGAVGVTLSTLVIERNDRVAATALAGAVVFDTTHARDGILDLRAAIRAGGGATSAKKRVFPGDLMVSRLRPYLRQIAFVHPGALLLRDGANRTGPESLVCSPEFFVFAPAEAGGSLAYLLPFLLGPHVQALLAAGQEGGHHPRVPRETLLGVRVPAQVVRSRRATAASVLHALSAVYDAERAYARVVG